MLLTFFCAKIIFHFVEATFAEMEWFILIKHPKKHRSANFKLARFRGRNLFWLDYRAFAVCKLKTNTHLILILWCTYTLLPPHKQYTTEYFIIFVGLSEEGIKEQLKMLQPCSNFAFITSHKSDIHEYYT